MGFGSFFSGVASIVKSIAGKAASAVATRGGIKGILTGGIKQFAISFIASAVFSYAYKKLAGKPKEPDLTGFDSEITNRSTLVKSPISARQKVYGKVKKSGTLVYASTTGSDNKYLHLIIALASHEIQSIDKVFFNDQAIDLSTDIDGSGNVTTGTFKDKARIKTTLGTTTQAADSDLVSEDSNWTSSHQLKGIAYVYVRLEFDADVYPNGIPNISALIQGKKILDYRTSTTAYSTNPALVIYDYLTSSDGMNASTSEIDTTSFTSAANDCEDSITLKDSSTQNRYDCHGVVTLDRKPIEIIEDILSSCVGTLTYEQGKFVLKVGKSRSSSKTITENDIAGEINVRAKPKRQDLYNQVRGTFSDEDNNYIATDFPIVESSSYQTADGEIVSREIQLPFTTNVAMAERIALILLKQSRQMISLNFIAKPTLLNLSVGDVVTLTLNKLGFSSKQFLVTSYTLNENLTSDISLQEYNSAVYDYNSATDQTTITAPANINLPSAYSVTAPTNLILDDELRISNEGIVTSVMTVSATVSSDAFVGRYECQFKKASDTNYTDVGIGTAPNFDIHGVIDGTLYDVRIRAINSIGVKSAFLTGQHTVVGELDPPSDVQDFSINIVGQDAFLSWSAVNDLDLAYYSINYSTLTSGAEWQNSIPLIQKIARPATSCTVGARTGSYLIKSVDKSGNFSSKEAVISTNITAIGNFNAVATQTENPDFTGTKTNVAVVNNNLVLDTTELFDDNVTDNFDDITNRNFDGGTQSGNLQSSGNYLFSDVIDIGGVFTSRVTANVTQLSTDRDRLFDNISGSFDAQTSNFDGDAPVQSDSHLEIALSDDNITYTAFKNFSVADYSARYYKFRIVLTSRNGSATPIITGLSVTIDMPDRIFSGNDIVSGTGTKTVTFTNPFYTNTYAIGISAQGLQSGDFYQITNKQTGS
jgi:hypothetical protein